MISRRKKAESLAINLIEKPNSMTTVPLGSPLAGFGMFALGSGQSRTSGCLSVNHCTCAMRSQTCKHLMAARIKWTANGNARVWPDFELHTVLPREQFPYPPPLSPPPIGITQRVLSGLSAKGLVSAAPPTTQVACPASVDVSSRSETGAPAPVAFHGALTQLHRLEALHKRQAALLRRARRQLGVQQPVGSQISAASVFAASCVQDLLPIASHFADALDSAVSDLVSTTAEPGAVVALSPPSESLLSSLLQPDGDRHVSLRHNHRHAGSGLGHSRLHMQRKGTNPISMSKKQRKAGQEQPLSDSSEPHSDDDIVLGAESGAGSEFADVAASVTGAQALTGVAADSARGTTKRRRSTSHGYGPTGSASLRASSNRGRKYVASHRGRLPRYLRPEAATCTGSSTTVSGNRRGSGSVSQAQTTADAASGCESDSGPGESGALANFVTKSPPLAGVGPTGTGAVRVHSSRRARRAPTGTGMGTGTAMEAVPVVPVYSTS